MELKAAPVWEKVPPRLDRLVELAYNLWWSWHPEARVLFKMLDYPLWKETGHNPVKMLLAISPERLQAVARDPAFLKQYDAVVMSFETEMANGHLWFPMRYPGLMHYPIAYFSAEFGIHQSLPIYSGGLGILSGDHSKEASDLGLPFVGVGFMYPQGYFRQRIPPHGWQEAIYEQINPAEVPVRPITGPDGEPLVISVQMDDHPVYVEVWRVQVGRVNLYLMDTDIEQNAPWDRELSARLYGGDQEMRIKQEIILGIGGVRVLRALEIHPAAWHLNEGHSAFLVLERIRELVQAGLSFEEAADQVRATTIFTTHTPVPAGHDVFPFHLMEKYFWHYWGEMGLDRDRFMALGAYDQGWGVGFNMTALALRYSGWRNGVSRLHGEVSRRMWQPVWPELERAEDVPITSITNGVHLPTWVAGAMDRLYDRYLGSDWLEHHDDPLFWERVQEIPDEALWEVHLYLKRKLMAFIRERARRKRIRGEMDPEQVLAAGTFLDPEALTIGFARRFATYKRATLIFHDIERLKRILNDPYRPVQIIFAGKAHPADDPGKHLIQYIYNLTKDPSFGGRIAFLEDYDMHMAHYLVQGVDVWLNNPRPPREASGTSGMKASINGVPNLSILDGWWAEGYNGANGWAFGRNREHESPEAQDAADAQALYRVLEEEVVPLFYQRDADGVPRAWIRVMKEAIRSTMPIFSTRRMVKEYTERMYVPAIRNAIALREAAERVLAVPPG